MDARAPTPELRPVAAPWLAVGLLALVALALGMVGLAEHGTARADPATPLDLLYGGLQLFLLQGGAVAPPIPWQLEVARFLAPAVGAYSLLRVLAGLFREQLESLRIRRARGHVLLCGLGRVGLPLARALLARGHTVVAIERNLASERLPLFRAAGGLVLLGDARSPHSLRAAGVERAERLIALAKSDGTNAEIVTQAREIVRGRRGVPPLSCVAQILEPGLCSLLRLQEMERHPDDPFRLELFNVFESAARQLLDEHPVEAGPGAGGRSASALVVGLGPFGEQLVQEMAHRWRFDHAEDAARLRIAVVDPRAGPRVAALARSLGDEARVELTAHTRDPLACDDPARETLASLDHPTLSAAYVCVDDEAAALSVGLQLHRHLAERDTPVVVGVSGGAGIASLLRARGPAGEEFRALHVHPLTERVAHPDVVLGGLREVLARAMHQDYVRARRADAAEVTGPSALAPWASLPEGLRASNRAQADHLFAKLRAIDCDLVPWSEDAPPILFTEDEVERLARMEHARWMEERLDDGWTRGEKDVERKRSPFLVPWESLDESVKKIDRDFVLGLPRFLARVGYRIERLRTS